MISQIFFNTLKTGRFTISNDALVNTFQKISNYIQFYSCYCFLVNSYTTENTVDEYTRRQSVNLLYTGCIKKKGKQIN